MTTAMVGTSDSSVGSAVGRDQTDAAAPMDPGLPGSAVGERERTWLGNAGELMRLLIDKAPGQRAP